MMVALTYHCFRFSLGRAWLQECLNEDCNEGWRVPVVFTLSKL